MRIKRTTDVATYQLPSRSDAWAFMRACEAASLSAGYPSLRAPHTVQVGIASNPNRETADVIACGAPIVDYAFAGSEYDL